MVGVSKSNKAHDAETNIGGENIFAGGGSQIKNVYEGLINHREATVQQCLLSIVAHLIETKLWKEHKEANRTSQKNDNRSNARGAFVFECPEQNEETGEKKNMNKRGKKNGKEKEKGLGAGN